MQGCCSIVFAGVNQPGIFFKQSFCKPNISAPNGFENILCLRHVSLPHPTFGGQRSTSCPYRPHMLYLPVRSPHINHPIAQSHNRSIPPARSKPVRILMLSWEYPPKIVGGIARHVEEISWALSARGDEVHVVTCEFPGAPAEETYNGVQIHRVAPYAPTHDFFHWVHQLNAAMRDRAEALLREWTS